MNWSDEAIIIEVFDYVENYCIMTVMSKLHGKQQGMIRKSKKKHRLYETCMGKIHWSSKLEGQLGFFKFEEQENYFFSCINNKTKLLAIKNILLLINMLIPQGDNSYEEVFWLLLKILRSLEYDDEWQITYMTEEIKLFNLLGYNLDISKCFINKEDVPYYISPRTGNAVSMETGAPYKDRLFKIPSFLLITSAEKPWFNKDIREYFAIFSYFFKKYMGIELYNKIAIIRLKLMYDFCKES